VRTHRRTRTLAVREAHPAPRTRPPTCVRSTALITLLLTLAFAYAFPGHAQATGSYARSLELRARLDATPRSSRTGVQYDRVLNAFRAVYHADRAAPHAAASVEAVAELLAEEGRDFHNPDLLRAAVEQLAFLRRDFGASPFAEPALMTQGEIEDRDLHDADAARGYFLQFLESYASSPLAPQVRVELRRVGGVPLAATQPATQYRASSAYRTPASVEPPQTANKPQVQASRQAARPPAEGTWAPDFPGDQSSTGAQSSAPSAARNTIRPRGYAEQGIPAERILNGVPIARREDVAAAGRRREVMVTGIRQWSTASYTRVAIDLTGEVPFEATRIADPDRVFFDLHGAHLASNLAGRAVTVADGGFLERIRAAQFSNDVVRVVLDVTNVSDYSAFWLPNPARLIIDIHGRPRGAPPIQYAQAVPPPGRSTSAAPPAVASVAPSSGSRRSFLEKDVPAPHAPVSIASEDAAARGRPALRSSRAAAPGTFVAGNTQAGAQPAAGDSVADIAAISQRGGQVKATTEPTTAPVSSEVAENQPPATVEAPKGRHRRHAAAPIPSVLPPETPGVMARAAAPDAGGGRSMVRALGLKINRIVIDAGHGGHDSGAIGPGGLEEKDVVLDVALRLGKLLKERLGADVIYTRDDDTFIPLETRTAIANKAQADLFISIHANSSSDPTVRGVETYYLNFTSSPDALEVAARENAVSDESIHQLSSLVKQITLHDKIEESREFAQDVQTSLYGGLEADNAGLKNRGVKEAPFVVLIGANMPSILAEISFVTSTASAEDLRQGAYRERIAESLYKGIARYVHSLSSAQADETAER
jgi:N-acetylmuramoyl-L-alanine amidase